MATKAAAQKVRTLRESRGLTQEELAERARLNQRTVQRIECGQHAANLRSLKALAEVLGVELNVLREPPRGGKQRRSSRPSPSHLAAAQRHIDAVAAKSEFVRALLADEESHRRWHGMLTNMYRDARWHGVGVLVMALMF